VEGDEIGLGQQLVQRHLLHAHLDGALRRQERVIGSDLHLEAQRAAGNDRSDIARANEAQRLAGELDAHEAVLLPLAGLGRGIGLGQLAGEREHQRDRMLGGRDRIAERCVHHDHALGTGIGNIDIVDADAGAADHLQVGGSVQYLLGHLGRGADGKAIILADHGLQLLRRLAGNLIHLNAAITEDLRGLGVHLVGNQYLGHDNLILALPVIPAKAGIHLPASRSSDRVGNGFPPARE
jgi:hypothetical protein